MKRTKGEKGFRSISLLIIFWLLLIFILSTQNGPETANTSKGLAGWIARLMYGNPNKYQLHDVHMAVRRAAHLLLFFILGILLWLLCMQKREKSIKVLGTWYLGSYGFLFFCSFFDEWHKQFIQGRHNDLNDAMLNLLGGTTGMLLMIFINYLKKRKLHTYEEKVMND